VSRISNDTNAIAEFASTSLVSLANDVIAIAGIVVALILLSSRLALVTMASVPVVVVSIEFLDKKMRAAYTHVEQEIAAVNTGVEEGSPGGALLSAYPGNLST
jgi:ATP-binding cassette, subfamily B, multidrug efflux pump